MNESTCMRNVVKDIMSEFYTEIVLKIGDIVPYKDGRPVKIKYGCYLDETYGRLSNHWTWNEVFDDGTFGPDESGYGWM